MCLFSMSNLLAQGGFGCVYYPALASPWRRGKSAVAKDYVSKVQRDDAAAENEIRIGAIISSYPHYQSFFLPVVRSWKVTIKGKNLDKFRDCAAIDELTTKYVAMDIPYVATSRLTELASHTPPRYRLLLLMEGYKVLLDAIVQLVAINVVHFDLKEDNVLYSRALTLPLIADFGISISKPEGLYLRSGDETELRRLKTCFYVYTTEYRVWCLDIIVLSWVAATGEWSRESAFAIEDDILGKPDNLAYMSPEMQKAWVCATQKQLKRYGRMSLIDLVNYLLGQWDTWDNYSLGVMYSSILLQVPTAEGTMFTADWQRLLMRGISPIPEERIPTVDARSAYESLFLLWKDPWKYAELAGEFGGLATISDKAAGVPDPSHLLKIEDADSGSEKQ